jgi:hypothetical protein
MFSRLSTIVYYVPVPRDRETRIPPQLEFLRQAQVVLNITAFHITHAARFVPAAEDMDLCHAHELHLIYIHIRLSVYPQGRHSACLHA